MNPECMYDRFQNCILRHRQYLHPHSSPVTLSFSLLKSIFNIVPPFGNSVQTLDYCSQDLSNLSEALLKPHPRPRRPPQVLTVSKPHEHPYSLSVVLLCRLSTIHMSMSLPNPNIIRSSMAEDIPQEVIVEILSRLPAKSLLRFRCVSKPWCHLISNDHSFIKLHLVRSIERNDVALLLRNKNKSFKKWMTYCLYDDYWNEMGSGLVAGRFSGSHLYCVDAQSSHTHFHIGSPLDPEGDISINFHLPYGVNEEGEIDVLYIAHDGHGNEKHSGMARGSLIVGDHGLTFSTECPLDINIDSSIVVGSCNGIVCLIRAGKVCLLNPCTREYKIVGIENGIDDDLAAYGFGYDATSENYKLVRFVSTSEYHSKLDAYSLNYTSCSTILNVPYTIPLLNSSGVFLNGALHWVALMKPTSCLSVICYDVGEQALREIPIPKGILGANNIPESAYKKVGVLEGKLYIVCHCEYDTTVFDIWVMKTYGAMDSWFKLFTIDAMIMKMIPKKSAFFNAYIMPLCVGNDGEILLMHSEGIVWYYPMEKATRDPKICSISNLPEFEDLVAHVPSLVRLMSGTYWSPGCFDSNSSDSTDKPDIEDDDDTSGRDGESAHFKGHIYV